MVRPVVLKPNFKPRIPTGPPEKFIPDDYTYDPDATQWKKDENGNWSRLAGQGINAH